MATKHKGLGRGLDALLSGNQGEPEAPRAPSTPQSLPLDALKPGKYQPRTRMDQASLAELAESIKSQGVIQPVLVRKLADGSYEIIAGERRTRAARLAGLNEVPVVLREVEDHAAAAMALIENIQREDLNPLEEAQALQRLIDEFDLTHAQAAEAVGRSRAAVSNLLRLLELPNAIRILVESKQLEMGHARALLTLSPELASKLAADAVEHGWSVREVEHRAQQFAAGRVPGGDTRTVTRNKARPQADIVSLENELSETLGTRVSIANGRGNKGRLVIHYGNLEALDGVLERLRAARG